ncbi:MAG: single-stranded DNA-binding protein [Bacteroidetes bacterium]|nr:single-stranded DNA-binding protein [Bacteroidota bacterium]
MNSIKNRVQLTGNLGAMPEVKNLENGNKVARFSVATSEDYLNKKGDKITTTQWHNIVAWGKLAGIAEQVLKKGEQVIIDGKLSTRSYTAKDGSKRYITEVIAQELLVNKK